MKKVRKLITGIFVWSVMFSDNAFAAVNIGLSKLSGTGLPSKTVPQVIGSVLRFVTSVTAILCVLMIVVSGIMYITAAGDSTKAGKAKDWMIHAITGLVIAILAYTIVIIVGRVAGAAW